MMDFKSGEILIYRDRVYKKSWQVIKLHPHPEWTAYSVCYVISSPPEDNEDINTIMNVPDFFLYRVEDGYVP